MNPIDVIKFLPMDEQLKPENCFLDESLIPYWHVINGGHGDGESTACGQEIDYNIKEKVGKVTCPHCLETIRFFKNLGESNKKFQTLAKAEGEGK